MFFIELEFLVTLATSSESPPSTTWPLAELKNTHGDLLIQPDTARIRSP
jgi:hypothetical protein